MARFKVYFDGKCVVCSKEIDYYRKKAGSSKIDWVDISVSGFDAKSEGLDASEIKRVFHVRDESGHLFTGVDGFVEIWKRLSGLSAWVKASQAPGAKHLMKLGYHVFIKIRPYLPRKSKDCHDGYCNRD